MEIFFTKMHGLGNDFIVIDNLNGRIVLSKKQIVFLCDRHKGIGADGLILVESQKESDSFMNYCNADGSEAEMCGNGIRCVAKFLKDGYFKSKDIFKIATRVGIKEVVCEKDGTFSVNMGQPVFSHSDFPESSLEFEGINFNFVSIGNPHAVGFVQNIKHCDLSGVGSHFERHKNFPNGINVELVEQKNKKQFEVLVWERGCGATLACGTGASAVYAVCRKYKNADKNAVISLPGGKLFFSENKNGEIIMRGPAQSAYSGIINV